LQNKEMKNPETIIQLIDVFKTYPGQKEPAINNISVSINRKQKVGLIGANGSGKTTIFRLILNLLQPESGKVLVKDLENLELAKKHIGFVSEYQQGLDNFSPQEILSLTGQMAGMKTSNIETRVNELLQWLNLENQRNELLAGFSKGMRQRIFLAISLFHKPEILLLDEPMSGLDPPSQIEYRSLLQELIPYTIIYASHQLSDVEDICDRIIFFYKGELVEDFNRGDYSNDIYILETENRILEILEKFSEIKVHRKRQTPENFQVEILTNPEMFQLFLQNCSENKIKINHLRTRSILEELYSKYIK
jgi:ABC-2 type transport system ATP-binding protein